MGRAEIIDSQARYPRRFGRNGLAVGALDFFYLPLSACYVGIKPTNGGPKSPKST
jgi:hypothetical protein